MAQVGAGIHDGVDLFNGGLWLGFFGKILFSVGNCLLMGASLATA